MPPVFNGGYCSLVQTTVEVIPSSDSTEHDPQHNLSIVQLVLQSYTNHVEHVIRGYLSPATYEMLAKECSLG